MKIIAPCQVPKCRTGTPIIAIGRGLAYDSFYKQDTYEIPDILPTGKYGYISDQLDELEAYCKRLIDNPNLASRMSRASRERAIQLFGKEVIRKQWEAFL